MIRSDPVSEPSFSSAMETREEAGVCMVTLPDVLPLSSKAAIRTELWLMATGEMDGRPSSPFQFQRMRPVAVASWFSRNRIDCSRQMPLQSASTCG